MPELSRLALIHSDPRALAALRFGFEREGVEVVTVSSTGAVDAGVDLVVAGGLEDGDGREVLARARAQAPVLYVGNGIGRDEALAAGASEVLDVPAFAQDVVTMARLLAQAGRDGNASGTLGEHFRLYFLLRAAMAARFRGVLTLARGLRRGEVRFYDGEATSAQVGSLHGMPALHQLLLWTDARFELRREDVVRRQQIPLSPEEVVEDAQRFVRELEGAAGELSLAAVYWVQDVDWTLPDAVVELCELFNGHYTLADVLEDSPLRVLETLAVAQTLSAVGLLVASDAEPAAIDEEAVAAIDWAALLPTGQQSETPVSQVVPSTAAAGEIGAHGGAGAQPGDGAADKSIVIDDELAAEAAEGGFSQAEEAFFTRGDTLADEPRRAELSFDDLDEGYDLPRGFWARLFRRPDSAPRKKK